MIEDITYLLGTKFFKLLLQIILSFDFSSCVPALHNVCKKTNILVSAKNITSYLLTFSNLTMFYILSSISFYLASTKYVVFTLSYHKYKSVFNQYYYQLLPIQYTLYNEHVFN